MADLRITAPGGDAGWHASRGDDGSYVAQYELRASAQAIYPLELDSGNSTSTTDVFRVSSDWNITVTLDKVKHEFVVREIYSDKIYVFYSFETEGDVDLDGDGFANNDDQLHGRLKQITTRQWYATTPTPIPGWRFIYNPSNGHLTRVVPPAPQDSYNIYYDYGTILTDKIAKVEVWNGSRPSGTPLMRVEYTYWDDVEDANPSANLSNLGDTKDLVQVKVSKRASNDTGTTLSIVRYTQYRYDSGLWLVGSALKGIYNHADIQEVIAQLSLVSEEAVLLLPDNTPVTGSGPTAVNLDSYASRWFEYYTYDYNTTSISTEWEPSGEDLETRYGGQGYSEAHDYRVRSERIRHGAAGCGTCSANGAGSVLKNYYYMWIPQGEESGYPYQYAIWHGYNNWYRHPNDINEVSMLVVEDTIAHDSTDPNGLRPLYRKVYGLNDYGRKLREILIEDPTGAEDDQDEVQCWCWAWTYFDADVNHDGDFKDIETDYPQLKHRVAQYRMPSAYDVASMQSVRWFLDPYDDANTNDGGSTGWQNDSYCLWDWEAGVTYLYDYEDDVYEPEKDLGLRNYTRIRHGQLDTDPKYVNAIWWGADDPGGSSNDQPRDRMIGSYIYPEATTNPSAGSRIQTKYEYDFYDTADTQLKRKTTLVPKVGSNQNGPGTDPSDPDNAEVVSSDEYYDEAGRLRWMKDGEGYVHYYSYCPTTGGLAYQVTDVNTSGTLAGDITNGSSGKWLDWGSGVPTGFTRDSNLPTALHIVRKTEFDALGREILRIDPPTASYPNGAKHYTAYPFVGGKEVVVKFPYWNADNEHTELPFQVSVLDGSGRLSATFQLSPLDHQFDIDINGSGVPYSIQPGLLSGGVSRKEYLYDGASSQPSEYRRYYGSGYHSTHYLYNPEGRPGATFQEVSSGKYQVDVILYDVMGRPKETRRGVDSSNTSTYAQLTATSPASGYATTSKIAYSSDGSVTSLKRYFGTGSTAFIDTVYHRTYRGHVRGIEVRNNTTDVKPYTVYDVDWLGRATATAAYTSEPSWSTVLTSGNYTAFIPGNNSNRYNRLYTSFDVLGRVYRTDSYPGVSSNQVLRTNNYYDLNGRLVCTGNKYGAHVEYAYDGAGRQYQVRTVLDVASTPYPSGGKFKYRDPQPDPHWKAGSSGLDASLVRTTDGNFMSTGNDGVIEFAHNVYDQDGNVTQQHTFEVNHNDTDGLSLASASTDYVRQSVYHWYNAANLVYATAELGSGDTASGPGAWKLAAVPAYTSPGTTSDTKLVTTFSYEYGDDGGKLYDTTTSPDGKKTVTHFDYLGRRTFVVENQDNFSGAGDEADIGGGTNNDKDRVTKWEYNGLNQVTKLRAYNGNSSTYQDTRYLYEYAHDASLVTNTIYPDSSDTTSLGTDQVKVTYNLNGQPATMTDQRNVVHTYTYDNARRLSLDGATTIPSGVDDTIKSIARTYTDLGEPWKVTSYANANGTGTIQNEIEYGYNYLRLVNNLYQSHQGAVNTSTTPKTTFTYDPDYIENETNILVFSDGLRRTNIGYPNATGAGLEIWYGGSDSISDRLGRSVYQKLWDGPLKAGDVARTFYYEYNGTSRLAGISDDGNASFTPNLKQLRYSTPGTYDSYDRFGRTIKQKWIRRSDSATHDEINYGYDYAGNRKWREDVLAAAQSPAVHQDEYYTYDGLNRLVSYDRGDLTGNPYNGISGTPSAQGDWTLDQLGNWSTYNSQTRTHNAANEILTATNWQNPTYDAAGNMADIPYPAYQAAAFYAKYDAWNRMVSLNEQTFPIAEYEYNGLNQRIYRNEKQYYNSFNSNEHLFYYDDQWRLLTDYNDSEGWIEAIYHWHPFYIDALATRMRADDIHFFTHDANFNVTAAINDATDAVVERYRYSPYGEVTVLDSNFAADSDQVSDIDNQHLYTGRERDPEYNLQLNRNRYYASSLGRWLNRDPIGYDGGSQNLYEYINSTPHFSTDPQGERAPVTAWEKIKCVGVAATFSAAATVCSGTLGGVDIAKKFCPKIPLPGPCCIAAGELSYLLENCKTGGPLNPQQQWFSDRMTEFAKGCGWYHIGRAGAGRPSRPAPGPAPGTPGGPALPP